MDDANEIWDEFQWEEFMREQDKKIDRYMELFYRYQDHPDRDKIIAREMGWEWLLNEEEKKNFSDEPPAEETEEGDGWKRSAGVEDELDDLQEYRTLPVYQKSKLFALHALRFVDTLPESFREDSTVVDFVSNAMIASAKIAGGTGMGDDIEELGANIAYCKRGLGAANLAIASLHEMKEKKLIEEPSYMEVMKEAVDVRNTIAIHIVDLREKFRRGV